MFKFFKNNANNNKGHFYAPVMNNRSQESLVTRDLSTPINRNDQADKTSDDMTEDLAKLINDAISIWAKKYHLETLPRDVILDQVLTILTAVRESL